MIKKLFWYVLFFVKIITLIILCFNWNFLWDSFLVATTKTPSILSMEGRSTIVNHFNSSFKFFLIFILIVIALDIFFTVLNSSLLGNVKHLLKEPAKSYIFFYLSLVWFSVFSVLILSWAVLLNFVAQTNLILADLGAFRLARPATTDEKNGLYQNTYSKDLETLFEDLDFKSDISVSDFKSWKALRLIEIKSELLTETFLRSYPAQEVQFKARLQAKQDLQVYVQDILIQKKQFALEAFDKLQTSVLVSHVFVFIAVSCAITALFFFRKGQITANDHRAAIDSVEDAAKYLRMDLSSIGEKVHKLETKVESILQSGSGQNNPSLPTLPSPPIPPSLPTLPSPPIPSVSTIQNLIPQNLITTGPGPVIDMSSGRIYFNSPLDLLQNRISVLEQKVALLSAHKIECDYNFEFIAEIIQQIPFN